ncbi:MAG TPA: ATP-binding protein [Acidimicrobiales bacterium]|nr:ATP-binding protein [Acidimicrobiales bacterium]
MTIANTVVDTPPSKIEQLFQPFPRVGTKSVGSTNGHGFGHAIVKAIAQADDARINANPRADGGLGVAIAFEISRNDPRR